MSHNAKYYRKKISSGTTEKCKKIDVLFKQQKLQNKQLECEQVECETSNSQKPGEQGEGDVESEVIQTNDSEKGETDTESEVESDDWIPTKKVKIDSRKRYNHEISFPWLYHSAAKEAYFCKYCEFRFGESKSGISSPFATGGVQSLGTHPTRKLERHQKSELHQHAQPVYMGSGTCKSADQNSSILQKLKQQNDAFKEEDKKRNLEYLGTHFKTAIYMLYKRWAITDNLSDMIEFLGNELNYKHVADHLVHHPTITYTTPSFVKEIVASLSFSIESELLESIREAGWYTY